MPRSARFVIPGVPHHVTHRGNRRGAIFFSDRDYRTYLELVTEGVRAAGTEVWAYCLMPNHVHFVLVPTTADGLRAAFAEAHRRYTSMINEREGWVGHLWQGRFASVPMDERHTHEAIRYVTLNPVRAGLVERADDWRWSSIHAHLSGRDGRLVTVTPVLERTGDFRAYLREPADEEALKAIKANAGSGRPVGAKTWIGELEERTGLTLTPERPGPKPWT